MSVQTSFAFSLSFDLARVLVGEHLAEARPELLLRCELAEVADLVPADPDVAVGEAVVPELAVMAGRDLDDPGGALRDAPSRTGTT